MLKTTLGINTYLILKIMKKVQFVPNQDFDISLLEVTAEDAPQLEMFRFVGFESRLVDEIVVIPGNSPRKTAYANGNVDVLEASLTGGWAVKYWPISIFRDDDGAEVLLDGRHTFKALKNLSVYSTPVAIYERIRTGNPVLDSLSDETAMGLAGLYTNAVDGTVNAVQSDFTRMISAACQTDNVPVTGKNVRLLMDICGVNQRYKNQSTITAIYNSIMGQTASSVNIFNTTKEEQTVWIESNKLFGINNFCGVDGVAVRKKALDKNNNYRYAGDILKTYFELNAPVRFIVFSNATDENQIESDRSDIVNRIREIYVNSANHYAERVGHKYGNILHLPQASIDDLNGL